LDTNVQALPTSITIKGENQKLVYFIETGVSLDTEINFDKVYDKAIIEYKGKTYTLQHFTQ
jgi:hypothetical protein